jgi:hypothetical protein
MNYRDDKKSLNLDFPDTIVTLRLRGPLSKFAIEHLLAKPIPNLKYLVTGKTTPVL